MKETCPNCNFLFDGEECPNCGCKVVSGKYPTKSDDTQKNGNGMAIASLIFGIFGILLSCLAIGIVPCVISLVLSAICLLKKKSGIGMAVAGLLCSLIGIFIFAMMLSGSGNTGSENTSKEPTNEYVETDFEKEDSEELASSEYEEKANVSLEEQTIYDDNGISITAKEMTEEKNSVVFNFVISNSSDFDYSVAAHSYSVNKVMAGENKYGINSVDVPSGKNSKLKIELDKTWIENTLKDEVQMLEAIFWIYKDGMKDFDTGKLEIKTNCYTGDYSYQTSEEVYSDDFVTVWRTGEKEFVVLNKGNYDCSYTVENCSVNDWSYELTDYTYDLYDKSIHSNCYSVFEIPIEEEFLNDNNISILENLEFDIFVSDDYWNYEGELWEHKTEKIKVEF